MAVAGIQGLSIADLNSGLPTTDGKAKLGKDEFLRLLTTQLKHQNPLEPLKDTEFMGQLAQFSTLEGIDKLNNNFQDMLMLQGLGQGANLIGKKVIYSRDGASNLSQGMVQAVRVQDNKVALIINGAEVSVNLVRGIVPA